MFEKLFDIKVQEGSVIKYPNVQIYQYPIWFRIGQTDHVIELVNKWSPTGKFRRVNTHFQTAFTYENLLMAEFPLTGNDIHKA